MSSAGAGASFCQGLRGAAPSVSPGTRSRHAPLSLEQLVGAMNVTPPQQYADVGSAFAAPLPPLPASCLANLSVGGASGAGEAAGSGVPGLQGIVRDGGERLLDVLLDERVFLFLREARTDAVSWERHLKWLRSDPRGDTEVLPSEGCTCAQYSVRMRTCTRRILTKHTIDQDRSCVNVCMSSSGNQGEHCLHTRTGASGGAGAARSHAPDRSYPRRPCRFPLAAGGCRQC